MGMGTGHASVQVVNSDQVPDGHLMKITFASDFPESIRATTYALTDSTTHEVFFRSGTDFNAAGIGPVGSGLLPLIRTQKTVEVDTTASGWAEGNTTNAELKVTYQPVLPINLRRPDYPVDFSIQFSDQVVDTSLAIFPIKAYPAKFRVIAHGPDGDQQMKFRFRDTDQDGTLSSADEYIDVVTYLASDPTAPKITWRIQLASDSPTGTDLTVPGAGDTYRVGLTEPYGANDILVFQTHGQHVDPSKAQQDFKMRPYVVPNPYLGSASFEPERFAISGRGERRIEFRGLPERCTIRIFNVKGELVQTLHHDGGTDGMTPWNLRTKDNLDVAPGLYIFHVDGGDLGTSIGKFAIVK